MSQTKFPTVVVALSDQDGNAFAIIGRTMRALQRGGATPEQIEAFRTEAESGDYDNVIQTVMRWVVTT